MLCVPTRGEHRTRFFALSCFLLSSWRASGQDRTEHQDTRTACPVLSSDEHFLSCPASYLRPGGRQDRTKIKNASCPTGQDTRTACPVLSSGSNGVSLIEEERSFDHVRYIGEVLLIALKYGNNILGTYWTFQQDGAKPDVQQ